LIPMLRLAFAKGTTTIHLSPATPGARQLPVGEGHETAIRSRRSDLISGDERVEGRCEKRDLRGVKRQVSCRLAGSLRCSNRHLVGRNLADWRLGLRRRCIREAGGNSGSGDARSEQELSTRNLLVRHAGLLAKFKPLAMRLDIARHGLTSMVPGI